jgi:methanogenic corrinoid protein MtbC1
MATAMTQYVMAQLYPHIPSAETTRGRAIITGVQGELHHVGANMVADLMEADGWDVRFLGTNLPHDGIVEAVEEHQADLLGISATLLASVPRVRALISGVREKLGSAAPQIVVGGAAFRSSPDLCSEVGADRFAPDARAAVGLHHP